MACTRDGPRERRRDILGNAEGKEAQSGKISTASGRDQQGRRVAAPGSSSHSRKEAIEATSHKGFAAAPGPVMNTKVVVCTSEAIDIGADKGCISREIKSQVFLTSLSRCCEQNKDHKQMAEPCQTSCPASGYTLSAIWDCQLPVHALLAMKFAPRVIGAPNSLLHQRLNRPPIIDRMA